ncbi:MAG: VanZ family protein [Betaproteobacteria bacterium]|nr:MAG: VanZ family protein [Betaproteobacteria bacterium]
MKPVATASERRNHLPFWVALFCFLVIVYASLQPFTGWVAPAKNLLQSTATLTTRWSYADALFNVVAYLPFGVALSACWPVAWRFWPRWVATIFFAAAVSLSLEMLQLWLPTRVASAVDILANVLGAAAGALLGTYLVQSTRLVRHLRRAREALFIDGATGDLIIVLLLVWLAAQANPGIPLFGAVFHPGTSGSFEPAVLAVEIAQTSAALVGIGLFTDLAMRKRWLGGLALMTVIALAVLLKTTAAQWFLTPAAWEIWLRPGHTLGLALGAILLTALFWLPRAVKSVIAGVALLSGVLVSLLIPDLVTAKAPLALFSWHYGQLLNLNGLTRTVALLWPFVATLVLLARFGYRSK